MSPEAQRIAIAKSVGIHLHDGDHAPSNYVFVTDLPDYCNCLNAIHNVEKKLKGMQWLNYVDSLLDVCGCETPTITATAAQRSEAYLRTICKWEGGSDEPQG